MDTYLIEQLRQLCETYKLNIDDEFYFKSAEYARILFEWNKTHSLTTYKNSTDLATNAFNSVYPISFLPSFESCLDVGSGAGFPAIPLALAMPNKSFTLVEPKGKKYAFLEYVKISLGIKNITVVKDRVENLDKKFNLITSRAVGSFEILTEICANVSDKKTNLLLYKGEKEVAKVENSNNDIEVFQMPFGSYILIRGNND